MSSYIFTSESVTEGHPDKIADQISDSILDAILKQDPEGRVACETMITTGLVLVAGEITTTCYVDIPKIVRGVIKRIGYDNAIYGFDHKACSVLTAIDEQSPDIAQGVGVGEDVPENKEQGAGDQGMMFGYACNDTDVLMPLPIHLSHRMAEKLSEVRKSGEIPFLRPDGKTQVSVRYVDGIPKDIDTVVLSTQHDPEVTNEELIKEIKEKVIKPICGKYLTPETKYLINPSGRFVIGGPPGDCGLTGRKIIVDTYGGIAAHGGGAFSGKDSSKVDRSGAYAARYIAKNIVAAKLADRCQVQLAYAIGVAEPVSIHIDTYGTGKVSEEILVKAIYEHFPVKPKDIIDELGLKAPIYSKTAAYGHFGRDGFPWENLDKVSILEKLL